MAVRGAPIMEMSQSGVIWLGQVTVFGQ